MKHGRGNSYAMIAEFVDEHALVEAARCARDAGYTKLDACSPVPIEALGDVLQLPRSPMPLIALVGGIIGACGGYLMLWYSAVIDYPWNVGGRPTNSWPSFIPITFELGVLGAALAIFAGVLVINRFPELYHPLHNAPTFRRASRDRFFLVIEARDEKFDPRETRRFLESLHPRRVDEVTG